MSPSRSALNDFPRAVESALTRVHLRRRGFWGVVGLGTRQDRGCGTRDAPRPDIQKIAFCTENSELRVWFWVATFFAFLLERMLISWPPLDDATFSLAIFFLSSSSWVATFFVFLLERMLISWPPLDDTTFSLAIFFLSSSSL